MASMERAERSDVRFTVVPDNEGSENACINLVKPREEHIFPFATLKMSVANEKQTSRKAGLPIKVDAKTLFTQLANLYERNWFYIGCIMIFPLLTLATIIMVCYFQYVKTPYLHVNLPVTSLSSADEAGIRITGTDPEELKKVITKNPSGVNPRTFFSDTLQVSRKNKSVMDGRQLSELATKKVSSNAELHNDVSETLVEENAYIPVSATGKADVAQEIIIPLQTAGSGPFSVNTGEHRQSDNTKEMRIMRGKSPDRYGELLYAAYTSYVAGNYSQAIQDYLLILDEIPDHREALLGMAAVAQNTGNPDKAWLIYMKVLARYPDDPAATSSLINLSNDMHNPDFAVTVQRLLHDHPRAAYLYFSLGILHAAMSRWSEAQKAFIQALRLDKDNPNYNYNLAICLEHLGETRTAVQYYYNALELMHEKPASFNDVAVKARIAFLSGTSSEK